MPRAANGYAGEQLGTYDTPVMRRWAKKQARRRMRQAGKIMLDDAPKKNRYAGWSD